MFSPHLPYLKQQMVWETCKNRDFCKVAVCPGLTKLSRGQDYTRKRLYRGSIQVIDFEEYYIGILFPFA